MFKKNIHFYITGAGRKCYYCGHEESEECNDDVPGKEVTCQMSDPEQDYFGDVCYVGHDGNQL